MPTREEIRGDCYSNQYKEAFVMKSKNPLAKVSKQEEKNTKTEPIRIEETRGTAREITVEYSIAERKTKQEGIKNWDVNPTRMWIGAFASCAIEGNPEGKRMIDLWNTDKPEFFKELRKWEIKEKR